MQLPLLGNVVRYSKIGVAERGCYFLLFSATFCYFLLFWASGFFGAAGGGAILCYFLLFGVVSHTKNNLFLKKPMPLC